MNTCESNSYLSHRLYIGDVKALKDKPIVIKEGAPYKIKIVFRVQREIVSGLRYFQASYRKGIRGEVIA